MPTREGPTADILIRDVPDHVLAALDARAKRPGLSRSDYVRRQLAAGAQRSRCGRRWPNGLPRAPSVPDLLVAAVAELAQLTVLRVNKDFELIGSGTGQPVERLNV